MPKIKRVKKSQPALPLEEKQTKKKKQLEKYEVSKWVKYTATFMAENEDHAELLLLNLFGLFNQGGEQNHESFYISNNPIAEGFVGARLDFPTYPKTQEGLKKKLNK